MVIKTGQTTNPNDMILGHTVWLFQYSPTASEILPSFSSDVPAIALFNGNTTITLILMAVDSEQEQSYDVTSTWADADIIRGAVIIGDYIYISMTDTGTSPDTHRVYRFAKNNLAAGGTLMTFSGAVTLGTSDTSSKIATDGTFVYFNHQAGNSANAYAIAKYSISGTTLTYVSTTNLGSTHDDVTNFAVKANGDFIALNQTTAVVRRYNSSGTLQDTSIAHRTTGLANALHFIQDFLLYVGYSSTEVLIMVRLPIV